MFVSFFKSVWSFVSAVLLLALTVCAVEVGLRAYRAYRNVSTAPGDLRKTPLVDQMCRPSRHTFLEAVPGKKLILVQSDTGEEYDIKLNDFGLRGPVVQIPKPDVFRVLFLGDETIMGPQVAADALVTTRLQQLLTERSSVPIEVINVGLPQSCPLQAALWLRHSRLATECDLILHHFDMSDVTDDYTIRPFVLMGKTGTPYCGIHPMLLEGKTDRTKIVRDEFLVLQKGEQKLAEIWAQRSSPRTRADVGDPLNRYRWLEDNPPDWSVPIAQSIGALGQCRRVIPDRIPYVVTTCPKPWQVSENATPSISTRLDEGVPPRAFYRSRKPFEAVEEFCREQRLPLFRGDVLFLQQPDPEMLFFKRSAGLSERGHELYAQGVARFLIERVSGPWGRVGSPGAAAEEIIEARWEKASEGGTPSSTITQ
jgi:hypothetical protein